jgi:hypothetical protein
LRLRLNKHNYSTEYKVCDKHGKWHTQCNCILIITVQSAKNQVRAELEVRSSFVDLFGIGSSQSQDDPPTPPPWRRKRYSDWRRGTRWRKRTLTVTMTMEAEASKAGDTAAAAEAEGSVREVSRVRVST